MIHPNPGGPRGDIVVLVAGDVSMAPVADALGDIKRARDKAVIENQKSRRSRNDPLIPGDSFDCALLAEQPIPKFLERAEAALPQIVQPPDDHIQARQLCQPLV